jgi:hypothetical protein
LSDREYVLAHVVTTMLLVMWLFGIFDLPLMLFRWLYSG